KALPQPYCSRECSDGGGVGAWHAACAEHQGPHPRPGREKMQRNFNELRNSYGKKRSPQGKVIENVICHRNPFLSMYTSEFIVTDGDKAHPLRLRQMSLNHAGTTGKIQEKTKSVCSPECWMSVNRKL